MQGSGLRVIQVGCLRRDRLSYSGDAWHTCSSSVFRNLSRRPPQASSCLLTLFMSSALPACTPGVVLR